MGNTLGMTCPHCNEYASQSVTKTDPLLYRDRRIEDLTGSGDRPFRKRTRICYKCKTEFITIEIPEDAFDSLVDVAFSYKEMLNQRIAMGAKLGEVDAKSYLVDRALAGVRLIADILGCSQKDLSNAENIIRAGEVDGHALMDFVNDVDKVYNSLTISEQAHLGYFKNVSDEVTASEKPAVLNWWQIKKIRINLLHPSRFRILRPWYVRFFKIEDGV